MSPASRCVVLVPANGPVEPGCDDALRELERRGYPVWRVRGYAAIDAARNQMATDALAQGFDELLWIDSDVVFDPADVEKLRAHALPLVCGLYAKKSRREFACAFLPGTRQVLFGPNGGLLEVLYCGFGFVLTRRPLYEAMQRQLHLPVCNRRFGSPLVPYFAPLVAGEGDAAWYLGEDYAFCERARRCDFRVLADLTIRLWHVGAYRYSYSYSWEVAAERGLGQALQAGLARTRVAAVGPVVAEALRHKGGRVDVCPEQGWVMRNLVRHIVRSYEAGASSAANM